MIVVAQCSDLHEANAVAWTLKKAKIPAHVLDKASASVRYPGLPVTVNVSVSRSNAARAIKILAIEFPHLVARPDFQLCPSCSDRLKDMKPESYRPLGFLFALIVLFSTRVLGKTFCPSCRRIWEVAD